MYDLSTNRHGSGPLADVCGTVSPEGGLVCTRTAGHDGRHEAGTGRVEIALAWTDRDTAEAERRRAADRADFEGGAKR